MKHRGFTLIEILVVLAIISLLAAILFPLFARARESARRASCLSNMHQAGIGLMMYVQDFDERYPPAWHCGSTTSSCPPGALDTDTSKPSGVFKVSGNSGGNGHYQTWMDFIYLYVKNTQVFTCPSNRVNAVSTSYGYNLAFSNYNNYDIAFGGSSGAAPPSDPHGWTPLSLVAVTRPSEVIAIAEFQRNYSYSMRVGDFYNQAASSNSASNDIVAPHLGGGNAVYADGHAKWRSRQTMLSNIGADIHYCHISAPNYSQAFCSRAWNPFLN